MTVTTVTVYRSAGWLWRASAAHIEVDGQPVGVLRGKARLTLDLEPGRHTFGANIGRIRSAETQIHVTAGAPVILALRPNLERAAGRSGGEQLLLIETDSFADRGPALRQAYRDRPPVGYRRRSRTEQILWLAAFALLITGQILTHTGHKPLGVIISAPGMVVMIVATFRLFLYRPDR
jgi:hypothetical protein